MLVSISQRTSSVLCTKCFDLNQVWDVWKSTPLEHFWGIQGTLDQWISNVIVPQNRLKHRLLGPTARVPGSVGLGWGLRSCISGRLPDAADVADPLWDPALENQMAPAMINILTLKYAELKRMSFNIWQRYEYTYIQILNRVVRIASLKREELSNDLKEDSSYASAWISHFIFANESYMCVFLTPFF